jgi:hypothetical protein
MNEFLSNCDRHFSTSFEYDGKMYIRECHSVAGIHWHEVPPTSLNKQFYDLSVINRELVQSPFVEELEKAYLRAQKLKRIINE